MLNSLGTVDIEICHLCNFNCRYCYLLSKDEKGDPKLECLYDLLDRVAKVGPRIIWFTGGEPLMRPDIIELTQYASKIAKVGISTNGFFITAALAKKLARLGVDICLKLDSLDCEIQDFLTGFSGSHKAVLSAISQLKNAGYGQGPDLFLHASVTNYNYKGLPDLFSWARDQGLRPICTRWIPQGPNKNQDSDVPVNELKKLFIKLRGNDHIPWPANPGCTKMCNGCFIDVKGDVFPCFNLPILVGNVFRASLKSILEKEPFQIARNIREYLKGACGNCKYNNICYGCRGLAYAITGDWLAADPKCWRNPEAIN